MNIWLSFFHKTYQMNGGVKDMEPFIYFVLWYWLAMAGIASFD
jgi:hypothetical protein